MTRIAIIDPWAQDRSPSGRCIRRLVSGLGTEHDLTVFSPAFDQPQGGRARFVRLLALPRPGVLRLPSLWISSLFAFGWQRLRRGRFDLVISTDAWSPVGRVRYAHVCHAAYRRVAIDAPGFRGFVQRANRLMQVTAERLVFRRARAVVAVSDGLAADLQELYPRLAGHVYVVSNFVDIAAHEPPAGFDREAVRASMGFTADDRVLLFVALGHFETKGLPELLAALRALPADAALRLAVVGGYSDRLGRLAQHPDVIALGDRIRFVGFVDDVRSYYWSADAFVLPTRYETFSMVAYEAAVAGLPLVATPVHGVRDILVDGVTGWELSYGPASLSRALHDVANMPIAALRERGAKAREAAAGYGPDRFVASWKRLIDDGRLARGNGSRREVDRA